MVGRAEPGHFKYKRPSDTPVQEGPVIPRCRCGILKFLLNSILYLDFSLPTADRTKFSEDGSSSEARI